jgi:signal transduction histidine kinase
MSSNRFERFRRSLTFRLSIWYAAVFSFSALILFVLIYMLLVGAMERKDREVIEAHLKECVALYENGGLPALEELVANRDDAQIPKVFFVRLTGPRRNVLLLSAPAGWGDFGPSDLVNNGNVSQLVWFQIPGDELHDFTIAAMPLADGSVLQVGRSTNNRKTLFDPFRRTFLIVMVPTFLLAILGGGFLAYRATKPVRDVVATARSIIDTGDFSARVSTSASAMEFDELAQQFNRVLEKNQTLIVGMRAALDNVAHDLRTPLTRLRGTAELAVQSTTDPVACEALADCVEESDRVLTILTALMDIAEAEAGVVKLQLENTSVAGLLQNAIDLYELAAEEKRIQMTTDYAGRCEAVVDPMRMRQVFANLLDNAIKYTPEEGNVHISCRAVDGQVIVWVKDSGIGIPSDEQPHIWERLYRGDKSRSQRGLGLGLSLVKAYVEAHHGDVSVESTPGNGSVFTVRIPQAA